MINSKTLTYLLLALTIFSLQSCISRLRRPEITGVIVDYDKNPIANCKVGEVLTDKNGKFKLTEERYNAFFLTEMFAMEAPPLMVMEIVQKDGFEKDAVSIFHKWGGGQIKGAKYKVDTIFLRKVNQTFDISALLKNSNWKLGFTKNADTLFLVKDGFKDWCKTDRCSPFYDAFKALTDNYYSGAKNLPEGMIRRSIELKFVDEKSPVKIVRVQEYISTFEGPNRTPDTTTTNGNYQIISSQQMILNAGKINELTGKYHISEVDLYQMKLTKVKEK